MIVVILAGILIWHASKRDSSAQVHNADSPTYKTISPDGRSINTLGGWRRVSPPNSQPVYSYDDSIGGVSISVSQQPLPDSFTSNTSQKIAELAKGYNAADKFITDGTTVYVGTSAKGPQSVIFTKDNLLVLIKSQAVVNDQAWKQYVARLVHSGKDVSPRY